MQNFNVNWVNSAWAEQGLFFLFFAIIIYFFIRLKGAPLSHLGYALHLAHRSSGKHAQGEIPSFQSMMASLAFTMGMSSVVGVSAALLSGGIGAVFWMLVASFLGLVIKYVEALLAIKYRCMNQNGEICGGPMYYLTQCLGKRWLGIGYALFGLGVTWIGGSLLPSHVLMSSAQDVLHLPPLSTGLLLFFALLFVMRGGIRRIAKTISLWLPSTAIVYCAACLILLFSRLDAIPQAVYLLFTSAFSLQAIGGGLLGAAVSGALWGLSAQQVGWGNHTVFAAVAKTDVPGRQALIAMSASFLSLLLSALTALVLIVTNAVHLLSDGGITSMQLIGRAFETLLPGGGVIVFLLLFLFIFLSIVAWGYYGEKCVEFLGDGRIFSGYRIFYCLSILAPCFLHMESLFSLAGTLSAIMAFANVLGLVALSSVATIETRALLGLIEKEKRQRASPSKHLIS